MKTKLDKEVQKRIALRIVADVYSCLKIQFKMNVDNLDSGIMLKVLENHFDLHEFDYPAKTAEWGYMKMVSKIGKCIHCNPLKCFNFSYKKTNY